VERVTAATGGPAAPRASFVRGLTLIGVVALIAGNMLGTSLYTLPASLAQQVGPIGLLSWLITAAGFFLLALLYGSLGTRFPRTGGPYVFAREAFGDFAGFQTVWMYWLSAAVGNAAIVTGGIAYFTRLFPVLNDSLMYQALLAEGILWTLCLLNVLGIKVGARVQIAILLFSIVPLTVLGIVLFHFDPANLHPFAPKGIGALATGSALLVWAFSGIESATVPAEEVDQPGKMIRLGTMLGFGLATLVFFVFALAVTGALPNDVVASSAHPLELAAQQVLGPRAAFWVSVGAVFACLGVLNGWTLMVGRIPFSAAEDGIFFRAFGKLHPRFGTPHVALITGTMIAALLIPLYFVKGTLLDVFTLLILLANLGALFPYLYNSAAALMLARRPGGDWSAAMRLRTQAIALVCFIFLLWATYGVGQEVIFYGFIVMMAGVPLYIWFKTAERAP
jgi:APA family basic amino acid/polyamine antiporter